MKLKLAPVVALDRRRLDQLVRMADVKHSQTDDTIHQHHLSSGTSSGKFNFFSVWSLVNKLRVMYKTWKLCIRHV